MVILGEHTVARNVPAPRKRILLQKYAILRKPLTVILLYSYISNPSIYGIKKCV